MNHPILTGASAATAAAASLMLLATPALAATPTSSGPQKPSTASATCERAPWQRVVRGAPSFKAGDATGDYLWHDASGFHLRVTHPGHQREVFSGEITSSAAMGVSGYKLEKGDVARLSADHRTLVFVFSNHGYVDGVNFHTDCAATVAVSHLNLGNKVLPVSHVDLGASKAHPLHLPFTLHRRLSS